MSRFDAGGWTAPTRGRQIKTLVGTWRLEGQAPAARRVGDIGALDLGDEVAEEMGHQRVWHDDVVRRAVEQEPPEGGAVFRTDEPYVGHRPQLAGGVNGGGGVARDQ